MKLRGASLVAVVQAADGRNGDHAPSRRRRHWARDGGVFVQAQVCSCACVVGDVLSQHDTSARCPTERPRGVVGRPYTSAVTWIGRCPDRRRCSEENVLA